MLLGIAKAACALELLRCRDAMKCVW